MDIGIPCEMVVAPRAGAWIETSTGNLTISFASTSLPARERGLKLRRGPGPARNNASLPARERGLKLGDAYLVPYQCQVAPRAGAWIETLQDQEALLCQDQSLPARERGLKPERFGPYRQQCRL